MLVILTVLGLTVAGLVAYFNRGGSDGGKGGEEDALAKTWKKIQSSPEHSGTMTHQQMVEAFEELQRMGLGQIQWREAEGTKDPTAPPSLALGFIHEDAGGEQWQANSEDVKRRSVLAATILRRKGFRTLGLEGAAKGTPLEKQIHLNGDMLDWRAVQEKVGSSPAFMRLLSDNRTAFHDVLIASQPPGTWKGTEDPAMLKKMQGEQSMRAALDSSVMRFLRPAAKAIRGDEFNIEMHNDPKTGSLLYVTIGGERFDAPALRKDLIRWRDLQRDDFNGPDAQARNDAFAASKDPVFIGTGHLRAVQEKAAKSGRKAGVFLPKGMGIGDIEDDRRVVIVNLTLNAMNNHANGKVGQ